MKRVLRTTAWLLAMLMLLGTTAFAWEAPTGNFKYFRDIPEEYWAAQDIEWCTDYQVMKDMGNRREFQPETALSRAMFVQICANLVTQMGQDISYTTVTEYPDVVEDQWFYGVVQWASEKGIVSGHENGTFTPDASVTRAEMAQMMYSFLTVYCGLTLDTDPTKANETYADAATLPAWAMDAIAAMTNLGLLAGEDGYFHADGTATRAQAAAIAHRLQQYYNSNPQCFTGKKLTLVWNDEFDGTELDTSKWRYGACGNLTAFGEAFADPEYVLQYQKDHIKVENGNLVMNVEYMDNSVMNPNDENYCGDQNCSVVWIDTAADTAAGETERKYEQTYGYFEMRCILGTGSGSNCAFWMGAGKAWDPTSESSRDGAEIDVFESIYTSTNFFEDGIEYRPKVESTVHWQHNAYDENGNKLGGKDNSYFWAEQRVTREEKYLPIDMFDGNYHTIGVLWTEEEYVFYYDGYEMYRTDCISTPENGLPATAQGTCEAPAWLLISCHFMDPDWYGPSSPEDYPTDFIVDYVRCYQLNDYLNEQPQA